MNSCPRVLLIHLAILFSLVISSIANASPSLVANIPSSVDVNEEFEITVTMNNYGSSVSGIGYLDISFPGNPSVEIIDYHSYWDKVTKLPAGSQLWHKNGYQFYSSYVLVSAEDDYWANGDSLYVTLRLKYTSTGTKYIYYRGTFGDGSISPSSSSYIDQQGWPVYRKTVTVNNINNPPSKASSPSPSDYASGISITTNLDWATASDPDGDSVSYNVYFGTDSSPDSGEYKGSASSSYYNLGTLNYDTRYYWRIDTYDGTLTTTGSVWRFDTESLPAYSISGQVTSRHWPYKPLKGISVSTDSGQSSTTDWQGKYTLNNVPSGTRTVTASHSSYFATGTASSDQKTVSLSGNRTGLDFADFSCKGYPDITISAPSVVSPGQSFTVTVTLKNTSYYLSDIDSYIDLSFDSSKVSVGAPTGSDWTELNSYPAGSTIYNYDGIQIISADHLVSAYRQGSFANNGAYSVSVPITVAANASGSVALKYRGTIGDRTDPAATGSGSTDQQGWNVYYKTLDINRAPAKAYLPGPSNGATNVPISSDLDWASVSDPDSDPVSYKVYFGTDSTPDSSEYQGTVSTSSYDIGSLSYDQDYYWRIDTYDGHTTTSGDVWHFRTEAQQTYSVSGQVKSRHWPNKVLEGITITADSGQSAATDWQGRYILENVPGGARTITASHPAYYATGTSSSAQQSISLSGNRNNIDFLDFSCKGFPDITISASSSVTPGQQFNVTLFVKNTNYTLSDIDTYIDLSIEYGDVTIGTPSGSGWTELNSFPVGSQLYRFDGTLITSSAHLISAYRQGSIATNETFSIVVPLTAAVNASGAVSLKYRGTIGDRTDPISTGTGVLDQQGWNVFEKSITVREAPPTRTIPILAYHKVADTIPSAVSNSEYWLRTADFKAHMDVVEKYGFTPISLQDIHNYILGVTTSLPQKPVIITFDDGYANFYTEAFQKVLKEKGFKATCFLITDFIGNDEATRRLSTWEPDDYENNYLASHLIWPEVSTMYSQSGGKISFEAHSKTHPDLTQISLSAAQSEIAGSRDAVLANLGIASKFFSYPYTAVNTDVVSLVEQAGFNGAVVVDNQVFNTSSSNLYKMNRIEVHKSDSVNYDDTHPESFFISKIDPDFEFPVLSILSTGFYDAESGLEVTELSPCQNVVVRTTVKNTGAPGSTIFSLNIDNNSDHGDGVIYDSHQVVPSEDKSVYFSSGEQKSIEFTYTVPCDANDGQTYYAILGIHDQHYVLGYEYSDWISVPITGSQYEWETWNDVSWSGTQYTLSLNKHKSSPTVMGEPLKYWLDNNNLIQAIKFEPDTGLTTAEKNYIALLAENQLVLKWELDTMIDDLSEWAEKYEYRTDENNGPCSPDLKNDFMHAKAAIAEAMKFSAVYYDGVTSFGGIDNPNVRNRVYRDILIELVTEQNKIVNQPELAQIGALQNYLKIAREIGNNAAAETITDMIDGTLADIEKGQLITLLGDLILGVEQSKLLSDAEKVRHTQNLRQFKTILGDALKLAKMGGDVCGAILAHLSINAESFERLELLKKIVQEVAGSDAANHDPELLCAIDMAITHLENMSDPNTGYFQCLADNMIDARVQTLDDFVTAVTNWSIDKYGKDFGTEAVKKILTHLGVKNPKIMALAGGAVWGLFSTYDSIKGSIETTRYISLQMTLEKEIYNWLSAKDVTQMTSMVEVRELLKAVMVNQELACNILDKHKVVLEGHWYSVFILDPMGGLNAFRDLFGYYDDAKRYLDDDIDEYTSRRENLINAYFATSAEAYTLIKRLNSGLAPVVPNDPAPRITVVSAPNQIKFGETAEIVVDIANTGGNAGISYFDISSSNDIHELDIAPTPFLTKYNIGDPIWHKDGYTFDAVNKLYSFVYPDVEAGSSSRYILRFTPGSSGAHWLKIRLSLGEDTTHTSFDRYPSSSSAVDQQGWACLQIDIDVLENQPPLISDSQPAAQSVILDSINPSQIFSLSGTDPDGDDSLLMTTWFIDGKPVGYQSTFNLTLADLEPGDHVILGLLDDGNQYARMIWDVSARHDLVGDFYEDGSVDVRDLILCLQVMSGSSTQTINLNADTNADMRIGLPDCIWLMNNME